MINKTIAAISTPLGPGGIGIIRISGGDALNILKRIFVRNNKKASRLVDNPNQAVAQSHIVYHGFVLEASTASVIDEVLAIYMKGPRSFTREDVVEIQSHSGYVVLDRILNAILDAGAQLAEPGEFTKRAFINGRIDLTQAEAVIDLINAPCETAAMLASRQMTGSVRNAVEELLKALSEMQAKCEAVIEFSDTDDLMIEPIINEISINISELIVPRVDSLIKQQKETAIYREGVLLAIAGVPNVGKSSLLNQLVEKETAIVSEVPGTTRDIVREYFSINGVPIILCDTAGIHDTVDPVECLGIEKARHHIQKADIVLIVIECNRRLNRFEEKLLTENENKRTIVVINKIDLADADTLNALEERLNGQRFIKVSAKNGAGIQELKDLIFRDLTGGKISINSDAVTPNLRQRKILESVSRIIEPGRGGFKTQPSAETVSAILNDAIHLLEDISGNRSKEALYDQIFNQFCIGK